MKPSIETKSKVSLTTFRPKDHGMLEYKEKPLMLGIIIGRVTSKSVKKNVSPSGEVNPDFVGMFGNFRCMLGSTLETAIQADRIQAGLCYLPESWQTPILDIIAETGNAVEFAYKVSIGKRGEDGYEWILSPLTEPKSDDELSRIMANVPNVAAIADNSEPAATVKASK